MIINNEYTLYYIKGEKMSLIEIFLISIGVAMDAFAVAICKGLAIRKINIKKAIIIGLYFGIFQAVMPTLGYLLGTTFKDLIFKIDHWIALLLFSSIGINMIKESFNKDDTYNDSLDIYTMLVLSLATSIDALAVGITFACLKVRIVIPVILIGIITCIISIIGAILGSKFGNKSESKAEIFGGTILILLGIKILLEHLKII